MRPAARVLTCALTATGVAAGCATDTTPPAPLAPSCAVAPFPPPYQALDPCSPEDVLTTAVTTIFTYRPAEHTDQRVAFRAATPLLTGSFAAAGESAALVWAPIPADRWQQWRRDGTALTTTVAVTADDHPADSVTEVNRVLAVTITATDRQVFEFAVYARAARLGRGSAWLLAGVQVLA